MRYIMVTPAYGKDYTRPGDALRDWNAGKDFRLQDPFLSGYISNRDMDKLPDDAQLSIRYNKGTDTVSIPRQPPVPDTPAEPDDDEDDYADE